MSKLRRHQLNVTGLFRVIVYYLTFSYPVYVQMHSFSLSWMTGCDGALAVFCSVHVAALVTETPLGFGMGLQAYLLAMNAVTSST